MQIDVNLTRTASDLITEFGAGAKLYLYSAATETGSYSLATSTALVSGTERYEIIDTAGTPGTTWYKTRVGDTGGSLFTDYSDSWLSTSLTAYATLDDLVETLSLGGDSTRYNYLTDLLGDVSGDVDSACGRQFYRSPQVTGTETFYLDVLRPGFSRLSFATNGAGCADGKALDLVSVTTLSVRFGESDPAYTTLTADTEYILQPGMGPGIAGTDWPYEDIELLWQSRFVTWPVGRRAVKVVGVRGFPKVPSAVKRGVISEARNRFRAGVADSAGTDSGPVTDDTDWLRVMFPPYVKRSWAAV